MTAALATNPSALAQLLHDRFAGRRSVYAKRVWLRDEDRWGYVPARRDPKVKDGSADLPLTVEVIERHLASRAATDAIGVYLVPDGERRVSFAALDIDNHGPAPLPWSEFAERVRPLIASLKRFGQPLAVRSGGGHGIHLVLFFGKPQEAAKVRSFLRHVVVGCGLNVAEGSNSAAGGMQAGVVEMFPKQDNVKVGDYGNLIALPFGRESVPLGDDLEPLSRDAAFERLGVVPPFDLPETREDRTQSTAEIPADAPVDGAGAANVVPFRRPGLDPASEAGVAEGGRDEMAWKWASKWRQEGLPIEEAELKMDLFCDGCEPPLDRKVGREKLHRAYKQYEPGDDKRKREAAVVAEMNKKHALVLIGGKPVILRERPGHEPDFLKQSGFEAFYRNEFVGKKSKATLWLSHPARRTYEEVVFAPGRETTDAYNLWSGFAVSPSAEGSCAIFLDHLLENVAQGDAELFRWIEAWLAQIVQRPAEKVGTSLVLRGAQGTGKTKVGEVMSKLLGSHYLLVDDPRYVVGNFNAHLTRLILLHADEAFFAGDRGSVGKLRSLVTSEKTMLELKGLDAIRVDNFMRLLITSDRSWVVPAAIEERRFAVVDMSNKRRQDTTYFKAMDAELAAGGYAALLKHLLEVDIDAVDLRSIPKTKALLDQKAHSMDSVQLFWYTRLCEGEIAVDDDNWPAEISKCNMYQEYLREARDTNQRYRPNDKQFGIELKKLCPALETCKMWVDYKREDGTEGSKRVNGYRLPSLAECRTAFETAAGAECEWPDPPGEAF